MTLSALVVLAAGLAAAAGPAPNLAAPAKRGSAAPMLAARDRSRPEVTCSLRIVHAPEGVDAGMLALHLTRLGNGVAAEDAIVRDSVSPCAGATTRRAAGSGGLQR